MEQEHALVVDPYIIVIGVDPGGMDMAAVTMARVMLDGSIHIIDACTFDPPPPNMIVFDEMVPYQKAQPKELPYYCRFNKKKWR